MLLGLRPAGAGVGLQPVPICRPRLCLLVLGRWPRLQCCWAFGPPAVESVCSRCPFAVRVFASYPRFVDWLDGLAFAATTWLTLLVIWTSLRERAWRAMGLALFALLVNALLWSVLVWSQEHAAVALGNRILLALLAAFAVLSSIRFFPKRTAPALDGLQRFDERDHMFARSNLSEHTDLAERYYASHPEARHVDARIALKPRLGEPGGRYYNPELTPIAAAAFALLDRSRPLACGEPSGQRVPCEPRALTRLIERVARLYGAADVGVTRLRDRHVYSHRGRHAEGWGKTIERSHTHAIVVVVAMDFDRIRCAPDAPVMVESSKQYVESARIANLMAGLLRAMGYEARAHVDGNYEVLCVPLAADAGLGEVGRMSLFMHRVHGPCVRLAVVTCNAELEETTPRSSGVEAFCEVCKKCADNCPSRAIVAGGRPESRGFSHWSIDQEACYRTWRSFGTDCAVCIRVCPFTKPNTLLHRIARWYVSRNPINQRIALWADDALYGRRHRMPRARAG